MVDGAALRAREMAGDAPTSLQDRLNILNRLAQQVRDRDLQEHDILHRMGKDLVRLLWLEALRV